jgi:hypothetical protein
MRLRISSNSSSSICLTAFPVHCLTVPSFAVVYLYFQTGMSRQAAEQLQQHLEQTAAKNAASSSHARLQAQRAELPAAAAREECLRLLQHHQVR